MNGFKVLAVGAFLYCGPSFCHAQISILDNQTWPRTTLVNAAQRDFLQPAAEADLTRADTDEISSNDIESPFPGANPSPSDNIIDANEAPAPVNDPASLPVGIRHRHNPIDQILRNGLISQTPDSAQVPITWPVQGTYNPTAQLMMNSGCTQGLWDGYPAERAAECALMYQRLAGHQRCHGCASGCKSCGPSACGSAGCGTAHFHQRNRYAPAVCDSSALAQRAAKTQPQFQSLVAPAPTLAQPLADESTNEVPGNQDNVAQLPGLFR